MDPVVALPLLLQPSADRAAVTSLGANRLRLTELPLGATARVICVDLPGSMGDRLVELGFTHDAPVTLLRKAPFGGPLQVRVRDFMLSLRREQAVAIAVRAAHAED